MSEPVPGPYRLTPTAAHDTPQIRAICLAAQDAMNTEFEARLMNLLVYGTTHPEHLNGYLA